MGAKHNIKNEMTVLKTTTEVQQRVGIKRREIHTNT